ncbi:hypothetical protein N0V90_010298 [Kalmusia sp. IMI 367209]|nr:hypothetical protein N0V90_010298 [Kalmusia sp. IMI 367209]
MSGNPFRASIIQNHPSAAPPTSFPQADSSNRSKDARDERQDDSVLDASSALPQRTKKSVRIESPTETIPPHPAFDDEDDNLSYGISRNRYAGSPPPEPQSTFANDLEDSGVHDSTRRQAVERGVTDNTWKSTGVSGSVHSPSGAPANPFSRTLASIEPQEKGGETAGQPKERTPTDKPTSGAARQSLNVEGFKNLLMQGITSPRSSAPPQSAPASHALSPAVFESSSSTDTSSISRQSIFDPLQEPNPESPRTSYDMAASDDEHVGLVGEVKKEKKKKPPPTPRHRHGKLMSSRTPQTVSFSDFSAAEATPSPSAHKRTNSDLNKPLPHPPTILPTAHIVSQDTTHEVASISDTKDSETVSISDATPTQKKVPPPVPLARRQSQLRTSTTGNRSRSNSSLTMSSQHSIELPPISYAQEPTSQPASHKAAPPPPPSRRHRAALSTLNTSSANSSSTELSISGAPQPPAVSSPNPPSSRRATLTSEPSSPVPGLTRTSSMHSARNNHRSVSNESANMPPPPPPPPRRRQSGRSSLDRERPNLSSSSPSGSRHTSTEHKRSSIDGRRPGSIASVSSLKHEYTPIAADSEQPLYSPREEVEEPDADKLEEFQRSGGSNASNILDDMERFQREIDELREKYKQAA